MDATITDHRVGLLLDGRYLLNQRIATGGMGTVFRATDTRLDRDVAVKVLPDGMAGQDKPVRLFMREAKSAAGLSHPNIVAVHDQGRDAASGVVFLVMELVPGGTLRDIMKARGALPPGEALALMEPIVEALAAAHRRGLVHRDVKPENVLVSPDGTIKVADFGLARAAAAGYQSMTVGSNYGTPAYLSPEQVLGQPATAQSDVYSLGLVLFELLTNSPAFSAESQHAMGNLRINNDVPSPSDLVSTVPGPVDGLVLRACSRELDERPADAGELLVKLREVRRMLGAANADVTAAEVIVASFIDRDPVLDLTDAATGVIRRDGGADGPDDDRTATSQLRPATHRTAVLGSATGVLEPYSADDGDEPPPDDVPVRRRRPGKGLVALLVVLLLAATAGGVGWYLGSGRWTDAPSLLKLTQTAATATAQRQGFAVDVAKAGPGDFSETVPAGVVLRQDPGPTDRIRRGGTVTISLSRGPERFIVPTLAGVPLEQASTMLTDLSLTVGSVDRQYSETVQEGAVISATPPTGTELKRSSVVDLVVSRGREPITIPDVRGQTLRSAGQALDGLGLRSLKGDEVFSDSVPSGDVVSQSIDPGQTRFRGDEITLTVSKGPELVAVPGVEAQKYKDAVTAIEGAGLKAKVNRLPGGPGLVLRQSPGSGSQVRPGSAVTLYVF